MCLISYQKDQKLNCKECIWDYCYTPIKQRWSCVCWYLVVTDRVIRSDQWFARGGTEEHCTNISMRKILKTTKKTIHVLERDCPLSICFPGKIAGEWKWDNFLSARTNWVSSFLLSSPSAPGLISSTVTKPKPTRSLGARLLDGGSSGLHDLV